MDPLVQFYLNTVPQNQQVPNISSRANAADFIRQSNPDVYRAFQQSSSGGGSSRVSQNVAGVQQYYRPPDPSASPFRQATSQVGTRVAAPFRAFWQESPLTAPGSGILRRPYQPGTPPAPVNIDTTMENLRLTGRVPGASVAGGVGGDVDWASILAALEGQRPSGGGVSVNRSLFQLSETPEEAAMLAREMADIEARRSAGDIALREGWGNVQAANTAAAEKARAMAAESGDRAAASWSNAAQQARDLAAGRAQAAGQFEGRAAIDVDAEGGAADFIRFMESQAPAERRLAERQQEILGSDLDWMAGMAGAQGEAYAGDLQRQANVMSFEPAREHNLRVQDRIAQERMTLAQMEQQAQIANASRQPSDPATRYSEILSLAASTGNPNLLASATGLTPQQAANEINNFWKALERETLAKKVG